MKLNFTKKISGSDYMSNMWNIKGNQNLFNLEEFKRLNLFVFDGNFEEVSIKTDEEKEILINENEIIFDLDQLQFPLSDDEIKCNDYILFSEVLTDKYILAKVISNYYFDSNSDFDNFKEIKFLRDIPIIHLKEETNTVINDYQNLDKININCMNDILNRFFLDTPYNPRNYNLEDGLKLILSNYSHLRKLIIRDNYATYEKDNLKSFIFNKFPKKGLIPIINSFDNISNDYDSFGSHHQGNLPPLTFLTIKFNKEGYSTGSSDFYYVVYLFRGDLNGVYLTLGIGSNHINKFDIDGFKNEIKEKCSDILNLNEFNPFKINLYCDLVDEDYSFNYATLFEKSTLFWKYYDFTDKKYFHNDLDLKKDLKDYMYLYEYSLENCDFESFKID